MQLRAGELVDRYRIAELLGEGGMGEVYRAHDTRLDREVALKILSSDDGGSAGTARLLKEARSAAALEHPNVVSVFDIGEIASPARLAGTPYLAMELVIGSPLRAFVRDPAISYNERLRWLVEIARALAAAHATGLVHRDVKPENVMIRSGDGVVKVLDFGIARRTVAAASASASTEPGSTGAVVVGTPAYMAPEQLRNEELDGRADQFAWGVLAYELLSGASPWGTAGGSLQMPSGILSTSPAELAKVAREVPPAVAAVVMRALAKSRHDRFPTMDALLEALTPSRAAPPPHRVRARWRWAAVALVVVTGAIAVTIVAMVAIVVTRAPSVREPAPPSIPAP